MGRNSKSLLRSINTFSCQFLFSWDWWLHIYWTTWNRKKSSHVGFNFNMQYQKPQNLWVQKVMSQRSAPVLTHFLPWVVLMAWFKPVPRYLFAHYVIIFALMYIRSDVYYVNFKLAKKSLKIINKLNVLCSMCMIWLWLEWVETLSWLQRLVWFITLG